MTMHTPGPWTMDGRMVIEATGDAVAMVNLARSVTIAHCDARLIAAAPDLLAALQSLVDLDDGDNSLCWSYERQFDNARAAIAKANS